MRLITAVGLIALAVARADAQSAAPRTITLPAPDATLKTEFTAVSAVRELSDGRLLIVDRPEKALVVADWAKGDVTPIGRNGSGPGEYLQPAALFALRGDSTLLPDVQNGRWLLLHGAAVAVTVGAGTPAIASGARRPLGADDDGRVIYTRGIGTGAGPGAVPRTDSVLLVRVARATGRSETLAVLRARPATITVRGPAKQPTSVSIMMNPLTTGELAALFPDGWIAIARLDPYRVEWIAPAGNHVRGSPLPFERVPLDAREKRAALERLAARTGRPPGDPNAFPAWPEVVPPFLGESLLPGPDGRLWIRHAPTAADSDPPYDVVDRRGALVARVTVGQGVAVVGFGRGAVYTVTTDDDGIQRMQRRPFPKF